MKQVNKKRGVFFAISTVVIGVALAVFADTTGDMLRWYGMDRAYSSGTYKPNFKNGYQVNGTAVSATQGAALNVTAGTVAASKAVVVDSNKDIGDFRNLSGTGLKAGKSGTAGTVTVFPTTASKGSVTLTAGDSSGDTVTGITTASQAAARTYTIPDASTSASTDANWKFVLMRAGSGAPSGFAAAQGSLYVDTANGKLYICTTGSATSATFALVGTQS